MTKELALLPLDGGKMNVATISDLSETPLWPLLHEGATIEDGRQAARKIAASASLRAQAEQLEPQVTRMARAVGTGEAGARQIFEAMQPMLILYGRPKKHDAELQAWWTIYYDQLGCLPRLALDAAVSAYIGTSKVHKIADPADLYRLATPTATRLHVAAWRLKQALQMKVEQRKVITDEDRAAVRAMMDDWRHQSAQKHAQHREQQQVRSPHQMAEHIRGMIDAGLTR